MITLTARRHRRRANRTDVVVAALAVTVLALTAGSGVQARHVTSPTRAYAAASASSQPSDNWPGPPLAPADNWPAPGQVTADNWPAA